MDPAPLPPELESGFRSGGTPGGLWGCGAGAAFFLFCLPFAGMLMMGDGGPPGAKNGVMFAALGAAIAVAAMLAIAVRFIVNRAWRRRGRADVDDPGRVPPFWAMILVLAVFAAAFWVYFAWWMGAI